jgi:CBS domain-containing protein
MAIQKTVTELDMFRQEMDSLSAKITSRAKEMDADIITIRNDPLITELWHTLCKNHRKATLLCAGIKGNKPEVCSIIEKPQACIDALHLSEEEICCEIFKRKLRTTNHEERKVEFLMSYPAITVNPDATIEHVRKTMKEHNVVIGIITKKDLNSKVYLAFKNPKEVLTQEIMTGKPIITIHPEADITDALKLMSDHTIKHLPVVRDGNSLIGMFGASDCYQE